MALGQDGADALLDHVVVHHVLQHVLGIGDVVGGQVHIDTHLLGAAFFLAVDPDIGRQFQVADEDMADVAHRAGVGNAHSFTCTSAVCQIRCWPPSTASIWPVTAGASSR